MPAIKLNVRELRAHLAEHINGQDPVIIKNYRRVVAVLLPTGLNRWASGEERKAALSRMRIMLEQDVREVIRGN